MRDSRFSTNTGCKVQLCLYELDHCITISISLGLSGFTCGPHQEAKSAPITLIPDIVPDQNRALKKVEVRLES